MEKTLYNGAHGLLIERGRDIIKLVPFLHS